MKRTGNRVVAAVLTVGMIGLCGCISENYTGRQYPPTQIDKITYYNSTNDVPETKLVRIGRCVITAPDTYSGKRLKDAAMKKAAEVGADAVAYYDFKKIDTGEVTLPASRTRGDANVSGKWDQFGRTTDSSPIYTDSFGSTGSSLKTNSKPVYESRLRVIFYRSRSKELNMPVVIKKTQVEKGKSGEKAPEPPK